MNVKKKALIAAFPHTIPVLTGFLFLGIGFGVLMSAKGYGPGWTVFMSMVVFAGAMQYAAVALLTTAFNPIYALLLTLLVNSRHLFYGVSMLEKFKNTGRLKPFLIFGMCDETFSLISSVEPPADVEKRWFMFFITVLDYSYWVIGCGIGNILGSLVSFNTMGIDFVLTALFTVLFINQWKGNENRIPGLVGLAVTVLCLLLFGADGFILPALALLLLVLTVFQKPIEMRRPS